MISFSTVLSGKWKVSSFVKPILSKEIKVKTLSVLKKEVKYEALVEGMDLTKEKTVLLAHQQGLADALIATITQLSLERVKDIIARSKEL